MVAPSTNLVAWFLFTMKYPDLIPGLLRPRFLCYLKILYISRLEISAKSFFHSLTERE